MTDHTGRKTPRPPVSAQTRAKMRAAALERFHSQATKSKIATSLKKSVLVRRARAISLPPRSHTPKSVRLSARRWL